MVPETAASHPVSDIRNAHISRLLATVASGDSRAFDELEPLIWPLISQVLWRFDLDHHEREDIAQEALLDLFRAAPSYRQENPSGFVFTIVRHTALRHVYRKRRRNAREVVMEFHHDVGPRRPMEKESYLTVLQCLKKLDIESRLCVVLSCLFGLNHVEISDGFAAGVLPDVEDTGILDKQEIREVLEGRSKMTRENSAQILSRALRRIRLCLEGQA